MRLQIGPCLEDENLLQFFLCNDPVISAYLHSQWTKMSCRFGVGRGVLNRDSMDDIEITGFAVSCTCSAVCHVLP